MSLKVDLVSPEKILLTAEANMVVARSVDGEIAFCPGHIPFIGVLNPDTVRVHLVDGNVFKADVSSGFVEVADDHITVLSDTVAIEDSSPEVSNKTDAQ